MIDENAYTDTELASPQAISSLLTLLDGWLRDRPDLRRMFALWIRATLMRKAGYRILLPQIDDLQELNLMLAERLEEWAHGYKAEGMQQGMQQGEALALQRLLVKRFGVASAEIVARITTASSQEIEMWLDRAIDARTLDDIFGPTTH